MAALVRAVELLTSPPEGSSRDAWLDECLRQVRDAIEAPHDPASDDAVQELEHLLLLPNDQPGWLRAALDAPDLNGRTSHLPAGLDASAALLPVLSLRCALIAGLATIGRLRGWRHTLGQAFDEVGTGMMIFGSDGLHEVARNACLDELLEEEPARDGLLAALAAEARRVAGSSEASREADRELALVGGTYRVVGSRAAAGALLPEAAVLLLIDRLSQGLPTTQELRITFGLRGREPQVALLAAEGLSNADIADRLRLSSHTVRHYLERVLERLGLHSRKALALHLMAGGTERPPSTQRRPH
ncbi:MAG TPA: helix-turn-helix transcriptional regulator [Gemmatimonadales bacterium]|nr:helix-turn-helix transcriptional regulator [Gemmatimonadales bacterium]